MCVWPRGGMYSEGGARLPLPDLRVMRPAGNFFAVCGWRWPQKHENRVVMSSTARTSLYALAGWLMSALSALGFRPALARLPR